MKNRILNFLDIYDCISQIAVIQVWIKTLKDIFFSVRILIKIVRINKRIHSDVKGDKPNFDQSRNTHAFTFHSFLRNCKLLQVWNSSPEKSMLPLTLSPSDHIWHCKIKKFVWSTSWKFETFIKTLKTWNFDLHWAYKPCIDSSYGIF